VQKSDRLQNGEREKGGVAIVRLSNKNANDIKEI